MASSRPSSPRLPDRHTVYLTNTAWKKLKERAILEDSSATSIIAYLLESFLNAPAEYPPLSRYQARLSEEVTEQRKHRTIYLPNATWERASAFCEEKKISISGVIEYLLMQYLGLLGEGAAAAPPDRPLADAGNQGLGRAKTPVRETPERLEFDLGENPFQINLTPGKDRPKKDHS